LPVPLNPAGETNAGGVPVGREVVDETDVGDVRKIVVSGHEGVEFRDVP
jgi:hypothetical protein